MNSSVWLRIASVLTLIHAILHTVGGMFGSPRNAIQVGARSVVQSLHFDAFGSTRSYWDFYFGFGLATSVTLLLSTALLWQLASLVRTDPGKARPFLVMLFLTFIALAVISWIYFFTPPFVFEVVIALCIGAAVILTGKRTKA